MRYALLVLLVAMTASDAWCWSRGSGSELGSSSTRASIIDGGIFGGDGSDGSWDTDVQGVSLTLNSDTPKRFTRLIVRAGDTLQIVAGPTWYGVGMIQCSEYLQLDGSIVASGLGSVAKTGASSTASDANGAAGNSAINSASVWSARSGIPLLWPVSGGASGSGASSSRTGGAGGSGAYSCSAASGGASAGAAGASGSSGSNYSTNAPLLPHGWWLGPLALVAPPASPSGGAGGGNGGGRGGDSGTSGASMVIEAVRATGSGSIVSAGTSAANENTVGGAGRGSTNMGGGGGGNGGHGGQIVVLHRRGTTPSYTCTVTAGSGGTGALAGYGGGSIKGGDGRAGTAGRSAIRKVW